MPFGTSVTDLSQVVIGDGGYIVKINISQLLVHKIESVQAQASSASTPIPAIVPVASLDILYSYVNNLNSPDLAFFHNSTELWVFLKGDGSDTVARANTTAYAVDDVVKNTAGTKRFKCKTAGISASSEPATFATMTSTSTVITDGTAEWLFIENIPNPDSFPYTANTRVAMFGKRKAMNTTADGDYIDCPDSDIKLLKAYILRSVWSAKKQFVPKFVLDTIKDEEFKIRNA